MTSMSHATTSVNADGDIRFGLAAIKGVGDAAVATIVEEREREWQILRYL